LAAALRSGVPNQAEGKDRELGYSGDNLSALADRAFPDWGNKWKATNHAAAFPGKLMKPPGGIWGTSENAKDGGGSTEYHLGIRVVPDA